jgi:hypothetical protein
MALLLYRTGYVRRYNHRKMNVKEKEELLMTFSHQKDLYLFQDDVRETAWGYGATQPNAGVILVPLFDGRGGAL